MTDRKPVRYDVSVAASGDTRIIDVEIGRGIQYSEFPMDYGSAKTLYLMLGDALARLDDSVTPVLERPLRMEDFSARTWNALDRAKGMKTVGDLARWSAADLLDLRGFGKMCLEEVALYLSRQGLPRPAGRK